MAMDSLALCIAETRRKFLDWRQLLPRKPELVVGRWTIGHCTAEHFIDAIAWQIAIAHNILSSHASIHIEIGTADQRDV